MLLKSKVNDSRRTYHQHCGLARALDVVGERWTLLIVRDLLLGPRRYGDLLASLRGITTNLLAKRLRELEAASLVEKRELPPPARTTVYALTDEGRALEPAVMELARWGGRFLAAPRRGDRRDVGWALLSMKRRYMGGHASLVAAVSAGERHFELVLGPERLEVQEKTSDRAALSVVFTDEASFFALFFEGVPARELERAGALRVEDPGGRFPEFFARFAAPPVGPRGAPGKTGVWARP
jgi:DNA-binding HxlR family transcriptional regulator